MEDRKVYRISRLFGLILAASLVAVPAHADHHFTWPTDVVVESNPQAVVVEAETSGSLPGGTGAQASGSGSGCSLQGPGNVTRLADASSTLLAFTVVCDGESIGVVWLPPDDGGGPAAAPAAPSPEEIAMRLRDRIPIPNVTIEVNPERGLVGLESWFWVEGYDGSPIVESTDAFGSRVEVEARVDRYRWSFGDGATLSGDSTGSPYPQRSEIRHTYERSSRGKPRGYEVEVGFEFSVRYRVGGGGWVDLPGIDRVGRAFYPVRESQAVISR